MFAVGKKAPQFSLPDQKGVLHTLREYLGTWVLIYFYPKDDTPGCTKEACAIRDAFPAFKKGKAVVLGISKDSSQSHKKFAEKYNLPFVLLADEDAKVITQYGAWQQKKFMGRSYMGIVRSSYLIDPKGVVRKVYMQVKPERHAKEVLADLAVLQKSSRE